MRFAGRISCDLGMYMGDITSFLCSISTPSDRRTFAPSVDEMLLLPWGGLLLFLSVSCYAFPSAFSAGFRTAMVSSEVQSGLPTTVSGLTHNTTTNSGSTVRTFPTSKALPHSSPLGGSSKDALSNLSSIEPSGWTLPQIGDCYHQWMQYWNATAGESVTDEDPEQITTILSSTESAKTYYSTVSVPVSEIAFTRTKTLINKGPGYVFPIATSTSTAIDTQTVGGDSSFEVSTGPTVTYVTTIVTTVEVSTSTTTAMITTPGCTLPSIVPQCQSAWNTFLRSGGDRPICEAASIASSACQSSIEARFSGGRIFGASGIHAWVTDGNTTFWPTRTSYAPGCTLGCQSCAITGDTVRVLYWPPSTASIDKPGMNERAVPVSTRSDTKLVTALVGNTTLTSPTVYVSYRTLYASNSCGRVGRAFTDIIVPLAQHQELSSLAYTQLDDWAFGPGRWGLGVYTLHKHPDGSPQQTPLMRKSCRRFVEVYHKVIRLQRSDRACSEQHLQPTSMVRILPRRSLIPSLPRWHPPRPSDLRLQPSSIVRSTHSRSYRGILTGAGVGVVLGLVWRAVRSS